MSMATDNDQLKKEEASLALAAFVWFCRLIAIFCLYAGFKYWVQLIGYQEGPNNRFDTMPIHWQVAAATLAVLFPVAATGLWMVVSWGPVIWAAAAGGEFIMYYWFPHLFGSMPLTLSAHAAVAMLYFAFRLALLREAAMRAR
jgi:fatty acid desaturase